MLVVVAAEDVGEVEDVELAVEIGEEVVVLSAEDEEVKGVPLIHEYAYVLSAMPSWYPLLLFHLLKTEAKVFTPRPLLRWQWC